MQYPNITPRTQHKQHGNIILKSEYAHLLKDDLNSDSLNNNLDLYNSVSRSNVHGQHCIPRYTLDNVDYKISMQANAEQSQLEREDSYQKHLKERLDTKFTSHERTLSRLSISIATNKVENNLRSYNNMLVDSLDAEVVVEDSLDVAGGGCEDLAIEVGGESDDASPTDPRHSPGKPHSAVLSEYGYGPIEETPIVDSSMKSAAQESAGAKRTSSESTPFTRGGHAWSHNATQPSAGVDDGNEDKADKADKADRLQQAQRERLYLEDQVQRKQEQLMRLKRDNAETDSSHQRQLAIIARTMDSHLLSEQKQPARHVYDQTTDTKRNEIAERRGLQRPYAREPIVLERSNDAENTAAWQTRIANQISPRTASKNSTPLASYSKTDFIAKNKEGSINRYVIEN